MPSLEAVGQQLHADEPSGAERLFDDRRPVAAAHGPVPLASVVPLFRAARAHGVRNDARREGRPEVVLGI